MTRQPIDPRSPDGEASDEEVEEVREAEEMLGTETDEQLPLTETALEMIDAEEAETEASATTMAGTDRDAELEQLGDNADIEPSLDEVLRRRTRGER